MKRTLVIIIGLILVLGGKASAQDTTDFSSAYFAFDAGYLGIKDELNKGFVFRGGVIQAAVGYRYKKDIGLFDYSFTAGGGALTGVGISIAARFEPINARYLFRVHDKERFSLYLGPAVNANYNYPRWLWYSHYATRNGEIRSVSA